MVQATLRWYHPSTCLKYTVFIDAEQTTPEINNLYCQLCSYTTHPSTMHVLRMRLNFLTSTEQPELKLTFLSRHISVLQIKYRQVQFEMINRTSSTYIYCEISGSHAGDTQQGHDSTSRIYYNMTLL